MKRKILLGLFILVMAVTETSAVVRYVKENPGGRADGSSWANASEDLQEMIDVSGLGDTVWVAAGYYHPTYKVGEAGSDKRIFLLKSGVSVYGGFQGREVLLSERNPKKYKSTLYSDDAYHVVVAVNTANDQSIVLDGFEIHGGYTEGIEASGAVINGIPVPSSSGGGVYAYNSGNGSITLINNHIHYCNASGNGGGVYAEAGNGNIILRNNDFEYNNGNYYANTTSDRLGGGVYALTTNTNAKIQLIGNLFRHNGNTSVDSYTHKGGGVYARTQTGKISLINNTLNDNHASAGSGIYTHTEAGGSVDIYNSIVWNNVITEGEHNIDGLGAGILNIAYNYLSENYLPTGSTDGGHNIFSAENPFKDESYQLGYTSPCIDKGDPSLVGADDKDFAGFARKSGAGVDIGVFECQMPLSATTRLHVSKKAEYEETGYSGSGDNWGNSIFELADALKYAETHPGITEIWVAAGYKNGDYFQDFNYAPLYKAGNGTEDKDCAFVLPPGIQLYGGFLGDETNLSQRNRGVYTRLNGNDIPYHIVIAVNTSDNQSILMDGFELSSGKATGDDVAVTVNGISIPHSSGGGIYAYNSGNKSIILRNNTIHNCSADGNGGGVYAKAEEGSIVLHNNDFYSNNSNFITAPNKFGGGVYAFTTSANAEIQLTGNLFRSNGYYATSTDDYRTHKGGGIYARADAGKISLTNNTLSNNHASEGAGIYVNKETAGQVDIYNNIVWLNTAPKTNSNNPDEEKNIDGNLNGAVQVDYNYLGENSLSGGFTNGGNNILSGENPFLAGNNEFYQLGYTSPCIDQGDDSRVDGNGTDMTGSIRKSGSHVDIGAFEYRMPAPTTTRLYVNNSQGDDYPGQRRYSGNGEQWEEPLGELAVALKYAETHPIITEIWVAKGEGYHPLYGIGGSSDERDRSFVLPPGVSVYGGFNGNETDRAHRAKDNPTILSPANNAYHVVIAVNNNNPTKPIVFDGFSIQNGVADGEGAVTVNGRAVPRFYGGGIYAYANGGNTQITLSGNSISENRADSLGGGVYANANSGAQITLDGNNISYNKAHPGGGGVYASAGENAVLQLQNNSINDNNDLSIFNQAVQEIVKTRKGGGVYAYAGAAGAKINLTGNTLRNNNKLEHTYSIEVINLDFSSYGGGVYAFTAGEESEITLLGNTILENDYNYFYSDKLGVSGSVNVSGGGVYASTVGDNSRIKIENNTIHGNSDYYFYKNSYATIEFNLLGGGIYISSGPNNSSVHLNANYIYSNRAIQSGGGIYTEGSNALLSNNLIGDNYAKVGSGVYTAGTVTLSGNTIVHNKAIENGVGGGIYADGNSLVYNSIIWNNGNNIYKGTGDLTVSYSYIGSESLPVGISGVGNKLNPNNPGFINMWDNNYSYGYRLASYSECIGAGSNDYIDGNTTDLYGLPRLSGSTVDMGAHERLSLTPSGQRLYVNKSASGDRSGSSWGNAVPELSLALAYAEENPDGVREIWVAKGTYTPTYSSEGKIIRHRSFLLLPGISVYGGFNGTETQLADRNPAVHETVLSGKIGDDVGAVDHVVVLVGNKFGSKITLDGFTITGGGYDQNNADEGYQAGGIQIEPSYGGGVYLATSAQNNEITVSGNKITGNRALYGGGGIFVLPDFFGNENNTVFRIEANEIKDNQANNGGGVYVAYESHTFQGLRAVHIEANKISNNRAWNDGGGIHVLNWGEESLRLYIGSNLIHDNYAGSLGGGAYFTGSVLASGNTVVNNKANDGGGIFTESRGATVSNSIIWGNTAKTNSNYYSYYSNSLAYSYLGDIDAQYPDEYIGENTITNSADPGFTNYAGGNYSLSVSSICINKGNNSRAIPGSLIDVTGASRIYGGRIDMGAYENQSVLVPPIDHIYVNKAHASGNGSGDSWNNAFTELADALKYAEEYQDGAKEIWVAKGVYRPLYAIGQGQNSRTFLLPAGVSVYGGFEGGETSLASRNPAKNETILNGDIKNNDTGDIHNGFTNRRDNSYHLVVAAVNNSSQSIVFDGFTITGGGSDNYDYSGEIYVNGYTVSSYSGSGIYAFLDAGNIAINNVTITENRATDSGGGIYAEMINGTLTINNAAITGNSAARNAGVHTEMKGGIFTLNATAITGNTSDYSASGIFTSIDNPNAIFTLRNSLISDNRTISNYGFGVNLELDDREGKIILSGVTVSNNKFDGSSDEFSEVYIDDHTHGNANVSIYNSIIWNKEAVHGLSGYGVWDMDYNYLSEDPSIRNPDIDIVPGSNHIINTKNPFISYETGDYRLGSSICVDAGNDAKALGATDITGAPRIHGSKVDIGAYEFDDSYELDPVIWTGAVNTAWSNTGNWDSGEIPNTTSSVYIPGGLANYPVLSATTQIKEIRFGPGAEIGNQHHLTDGYKAYVQLDFSATGLSRDRWYMLSSPLQQLYVGDFSFSGYPGMDMNLFQIDPGQGNKTVWKKPSSGLTHSFSEGDGFLLWLAPDPLGKRAKGLKLSNGILELPYFDNSNVLSDVHWTHTYNSATRESTFKGWKEENGLIVETGTQVEVSRDPSTPYRLAGQTVNKTLAFGTAYFAIAGNPYMSSINFATLQTENPSVIKDTYYIWIGPGSNNSAPGSYAVHNVEYGSIGRTDVTLSDSIAPMQSFIIEKLGTSASATLKFDLEKIGVTAGSRPILRSATAQGDKLDIVASTAQVGVRTVIASRQEGSSSFGPADSRKLFGEINSLPEVYTLKPGANNEMVATAVNVLGEITGETLVPLAIATTHNGELTFAFSGMDTYNARIYLLDTETNTEIDLTGKAQYEYKFNYVPAQSGGTTVSNDSRFFIRLNKAATDITELASEAVRIYAPRPGTLQVVSTHPLHQVMVYNLQGARIYNAQVQTNTHKVDGLAAGVYIVKVVSGNTVTTEKVIIR
jgi:predicted outer membrane repeat protein